MDGYIRIPILEAAALCGLQMKPSTLDDIEVQARCPFCDDKSHHLYLNTEEDLCYCQNHRRGQQNGLSAACGESRGCCSSGSAADPKNKTGPSGPAP